MMRPRRMCCTALCLLIGCIDASSQPRIATTIDAIVEAPIKVSKLRLDTGGGYNILSRQSESQK